MIMAGFLPFSAIYIELYYIFASVWGHKARTCTVCCMQRMAMHITRLQGWLLAVHGG